MKFKTYLFLILLLPPSMCLSQVQILKNVPAFTKDNQAFKSEKLTEVTSFTMKNMFNKNQARRNGVTYLTPQLYDILQSQTVFVYSITETYNKGEIDAQISVLNTRIAQLDSTIKAKDEQMRLWISNSIDSLDMERIINLEVEKVFASQNSMDSLIDVKLERIISVERELIRSQLIEELSKK